MDLRPAADIVSAHSLSARNLREFPKQGDINRARDALPHLTGVMRLQEASGATQLIATYDLGIDQPRLEQLAGLSELMVAGVGFEPTTFGL
jgi:hypothetical protein